MLISANIQKKTKLEREKERDTGQVRRLVSLKKKRKFYIFFVTIRQRLSITLKYR